MNGKFGKFQCYDGNAHALNYRATSGLRGLPLAGPLTSFYIKTHQSAGDERIRANLVLLFWECGLLEHS